MDSSNNRGSMPNPSTALAQLKERSFGMDVVRSMAIWTVMLAHIAYWFHPASDGLYVTYVMPLMLGVEPFFVLGGFLAAITFLKMRHQGRNAFVIDDVKLYWRRRWARTLPNYFLFLAIYTLAFSVVRSDFSFPPGYLLFTQNLFWLAPNFFSVSWSLATQEWFYLLFPLIFFIIFKAGGKRPIILAAALVILFSLAVRATYLATNEVSDLEGFLRRVAALRIDSVVIGVLIGWLYFSRRSTVLRSPLIVCGATAAIIALAYLRRQPEFNSLAAVQLLFYPCFSLLLALLMPRLYEMTETRRPRLNKVMENTSKWSYSIYLCHVFFKDAIFLVVDKLGLTTQLPLMIVLAVIWVALVYVTAALIYKHFEIPMMRRLLPAKATSAQTAPASSG